ncbi:MAG TPA: hypothetical protein VH855_25415 [Acetobacteraceae bacterium]|jgi:hypothetical protein
MEATQFRMTRVVLAAAHLDSDPTNNRLTNLRAFCQRCHLLHDRSHHLAQRWITYRRRLAIGDLFLGPYQVLVAAQGLATLDERLRALSGVEDPIERLKSVVNFASFCPRPGSNVERR